MTTPTISLEERLARTEAEMSRLSDRLLALDRNGLEKVGTRGLFTPKSEDYAGTRQVAARSDHNHLFEDIIAGVGVAFGRGALRQYLAIAYDTLTPQFVTDHVYHARDFGISPDVTDNYDRIMNAFDQLADDTTGSLEFGDGTFNYYGTLSLPTTSKVVLRGTGRNQTVLKQNNLGVSGLSLGNTAANVDSIAIENIAFTAAGPMTAGAMIDCNNVTGLVVDNVGINSGFIAIRYLDLTGSAGFARFTRVDIYDMTGGMDIGWDFGGSATGPAYVWIDGCTATGTGTSGIRSRGSSGLYITGGSNIGSFNKNLHLVPDAGGTVQDTFIETGVFDNALGAGGGNIFFDANSGGNIYRTAMSNGWATTAADNSVVIIEGAGEIIDIRIANSYILSAAGFGVYVDSMTRDLTLSTCAIEANGAGMKVVAGNVGRISLIGNTIVSNVGWGLDNQGVVSVLAGNTFESNGSGSMTGNNAVASAANTGLTAAQETYIRRDLIDARGDLLTGSANDTPQRVALGASGTYFGSDGTDALWRAQSTLDHGSLGGLADDDHAQYPLLAGRSGGQTQKGGTGAGDDYTIVSTNHGTKGQVYLGATQTVWYDETTDSLNLGTPTPSAVIPIAITRTNDSNQRIDLQNLSALTSAQASFRALNDATAVITLRAFGSGSTTTRFGITAANYVELVGSGASLLGLLIGTTTSDPVIFGTNNTEAGRIDTSQRWVLPLDYGSEASGGNKLIGSTTHATKGLITLGAAGNLVVDEAASRIGILTNTPTTSLAMLGGAVRTWQIERDPTGAGQTFFIKGSGALSGSTNTKGGDTFLSPGVSTGNASPGKVYISGSKGQASGTTDHNVEQVAGFGGFITLTDNTFATIITNSLSNNEGCGGTIFWHVVANDAGGNLLSRVGIVSYTVIRNAAGTASGAFTTVGTTGTATQTTAIVVETGGDTMPVDFQLSDDDIQIRADVNYAPSYIRCYFHCIASLEHAMTLV